MGTAAKLSSSVGPPPQTRVSFYAGCTSSHHLNLYGNHDSLIGYLAIRVDQGLFKLLGLGRENVLFFF
jgi:hypothetical protein